MSYILAITLNAAIDVTLALPNTLVPGEYNRVTQLLRLPGGKGINVARVLNTLGVPVQVSGFTGGSAVEFMKSELAQTGIEANFTRIAGGFRTCTAVIELNIHRATEINEAGPAISSDEANAFLELYDRLVSRAMLVSLSGSLPPGLPADYYAQLVERARAQGVPAFLDTSKEALRPGIAARPLFVKPNANEARDFMGGEIRTFEDAAVAGRVMCQQGTRITAITLGKDGAVVVTENGAWAARLQVPDPVTTVGCGDAFVAGFIASLYQAVQRGECQSIEEAISVPDIVRRSTIVAMACGAANTFQLGAGILTRKDVERLEDEVEVTTLE